MSKLSMSFDEKTGILKFGKWTIKAIETELVILNQQNKRAIIVDQEICEKSIENFFNHEETMHLFKVRAERKKGNDVLAKKA